MDTLPSAATSGAGIEPDAGIDAGLAAAMPEGSGLCSAAGFAADAGARFSSCLSVVCNDPSISGVSASTMAVTTGKDHDHHVDDDVELTIVHARLLADHDAQDIQATG